MLYGNCLSNKENFLEAKPFRSYLVMVLSHQWIFEEIAEQDKTCFEIELFYFSW
jgi:hypothetical protein